MVFTFLHCTDAFCLIFYSPGNALKKLFKILTFLFQWVSVTYPVQKPPETGGAEAGRRFTAKPVGLDDSALYPQMDS